MDLPNSPQSATPKKSFDSIFILLGFVVIGVAIVLFLLEGSMRVLDGRNTSMYKSVMMRVSGLESTSLVAKKNETHRIGRYVFEARSGMILDRFGESSGILMDGTKAIATF